MPEDGTGWLTRARQTYARHHERLGRATTLLGGCITAGAVFAPGLLQRAGGAFAVVVTSDAGHTLLLLVLVWMGVVSTDPQPVRSDGGTEDVAGELVLLAIAAFLGGALGAVAGDRWILVGAVWAVVVYLYFPD